MVTPGGRIAPSTTYLTWAGWRTRSSPFETLPITNAPSIAAAARVALAAKRRMKPGAAFFVRTFKRRRRLRIGYRERRASKAATEQGFGLLQTRFPRGSQFRVGARDDIMIGQAPPRARGRPLSRPGIGRPVGGFEVRSSRRRGCNERARPQDRARHRGRRRHWRCDLRDVFARQPPACSSPSPAISIKHFTKMQRHFLIGR
jgi:hypothetical protein